MYGETMFETYNCRTLLLKVKSEDTEYCSAVWCSAADTHLKLLDRVVSSACFLAGGVLN